MAVSDIILGEGVFMIGSANVGLTRGGGSFSVEREYRQIEADGDFGPVKGRIRKVRSTATLSFSALELSPENLLKFFPASRTTDSTTFLKYWAAQTIDSTEDYHTISFVGKNQAGKQVKVTINNAINMGNLELNMTDKEELLAEVTFTATYTEEDREIEPWEILFFD